VSAQCGVALVRRSRLGAACRPRTGALTVVGAIHRHAICGRGGGNVAGRIKRPSELDAFHPFANRRCDGMVVVRTHRCSNRPRRPEVTAATVTKTAKPTPKKATNASKTSTIATKPSPTVAENKSITAKDAPTSKPAPPSSVAEYIATLPADAQRYARKAWRHATGQRGTAPSLRGLTKGQAIVIRERVAQLVEAQKGGTR
jgi:hypothetical protein